MRAPAAPESPDNSHVAPHMNLFKQFRPQRAGESLTDLNTKPRPEIFEQFVGSVARTKEEVSKIKITSN